MATRILALEENELFIDQSVNETDITDTDFGQALSEMIQDTDNLDKLNTDIEVADNALDDLGKYQDIMQRDEDNDIPDDTIDAITIAVESIRKTIGWEDSKISLESHNTKKLSLEASISETAKKIWYALINAFKRAKIWVKEFFQSVFNKNLALDKKIEKTIEKLRTFNQWKIRQEKGTITVFYNKHLGSRNSFIEEVNQVYRSLELFIGVKHQIEKVIESNKDFKQINMLNYKIVTYTGHDNVTRFDIVKLDSVKEELPIKIDLIYIDDAIRVLTNFKYLLKQFNTQYKDVSSIVKELETVIKTVEENILLNIGHKDVDLKSFKEEHLDKSKSKLHFYTVFIPKFTTAIYSSLNEVVSAYSTIANNIPSRCRD